MLVLLVIVGGIILSRSMVLEVFPELALDMITVTTIYPGASPEEMEELITVPIEDEIADVDSIDSIESVSTEGRSFIIVKLAADVKDVYKVRQDIETEVNKVTDLPKEAEDSVVQEVTMAFPVCTVSIYGEADENLLRDLAEDLEDEITSIPGVGSVTITGIRDREIWIEVDAKRMYAYNLSISDIMDAVKRANLDLPGGVVQAKDTEVLLRTPGKFCSLEDIRNVIVTSDTAGRYVYVKDIASVRDTFEEEVTRARTNGRKAVNLDVRKKASGDSIKIADCTRAVLAQFKTRLPDGIDARVTIDFSKFIRNRLRTLLNQGLMGLALVIVVLYLFIGLRPAFMAALGIPFSLLGAIVVMYWTGITINMISLFSLILIIGMIVDDAIVVIENVYRHIEQGMPPTKAAVVGTEEVMMPVIASVSTTIAAFVPMLMVTGLIGKFIGTIPKVVAFALTASIIEALFILPSHLADWSGKRASIPKERPWLRSAIDLYAYFLEKAVRLRYVAVVGIIALAVAAAFIAKNLMGFEMFTNSYIDSFAIYVETPVGSNLDYTSRVAEKIEQVGLEMQNEFAYMTTMVGLTISENQVEYGTNRAEIMIDIADEGLTRSGQEIIDDMRQRVSKISGYTRVRFNENMHGPPVGKAVLLKVRGERIDVLQKIANELKCYLATIDGIVDISDDFVPGKNEVQVVIDKQRASRFGLDTNQIAYAVRNAFDGGKATKFNDADEEYDVLVKFRKEDRRRAADVNEMKIKTPTGAFVPFRNFAELRTRRGLSRINRFDRKRAITVSANVEKDRITSKRANDLIREKFSDIQRRYPGYQILQEGEEKDRLESLSSLINAFWIAILIIYVILGGLFKSFIQPIIVMFTVPFAFIGVVFGFFVAGLPLSFLCLIGVVALAGIVVNDSLILVDFINNERRSGAPRHEAVMTAGRLRFRPIILTSITTIFGLLPLAFLAKGQAAFLSPLAIAIVWGLVFSTILTLIIIPCVYSIVDDIVTFLKSLRRLFSHSPNTTPRTPEEP